MKIYKTVDEIAKALNLSLWRVASSDKFEDRQSGRLFYMLVRAVFESQEKVVYILGHNQRYTKFINNTS
jgi:hypothetical protein